MLLHKRLFWGFIFHQPKCWLFRYLPNINRLFYCIYTSNDLCWLSWMLLWSGIFVKTLYSELLFRFICKSVLKSHIYLYLVCNPVATLMAKTGVSFTNYVWPCHKQTPAKQQKLQWMYLNRNYSVFSIFSALQSGSTNGRTRKKFCLSGIGFFLPSMWQRQTGSRGWWEMCDRRWSCVLCRVFAEPLHSPLCEILWGLV